MYKNSFNPSQSCAIAAICESVREPVDKPKICILQGPPGTGKTYTIVGLIRQLVKVSDLTSHSVRARITSH